MNSFLWGLAVGGGVGCWAGIKMGGLLAVRRLVEFEYKTLTGRAGLRGKK